MSTITNYKNEIVRASTVLTTSYVAGTVIENVQSFDRMYLNAAFTKGSLTSAEIKVEFSWDGKTYFQETSSSVTSGVSTETLKEHKLIDEGNYIISIPFAARYIKISAKGTGTVTSSKLTINVTLNS